MKKNLLLVSFFCLFCSFAQGQMIINGELRYGNEWIDYEQSYLKIKIAKDGWCHLSVRELRSAGFPVEEVPLSAIRLQRLGEAVAVVRSTQAIASDSDYLAFYGMKNRSELDRQLFLDPDEEMLNPYYSMFSDTSVYFLSWENTVEASPEYTLRPNDLSDLPEKEAWYWHTDRKVFGERGYSRTYESQNLLTLSAYDKGEGFASEASRLHSIVFDPSPAQVDLEAQLRVQFFSNRFNNQLSIRLNGKEYVNETISPLAYLLKREVSIPLNELTTNTTLELENVNSTRPQYGVAFAELSYPRSFDALGNPQFTFDIPAGNRRYFEIDNFDTVGGKVWIYDLQAQTKMQAQLVGSTVRFAVPASGIPKKLLVINEVAGYQEADQVQSAQFEEIQQNQANFLIITHRQLTTPFENANQVEAYADYRRSAQGGGYQVEVIMVDQLYDQFVYGIHNHPLGIKNFSQWAVQNWPNLNYVLILGHGYNYLINRKGGNSPIQADFVPTYGYPGSDNLLFAPREGLVSSFAVGRVAAHNPQEIKQYLDKLKEYDDRLYNASSLEERLWRKRVLHISGGTDANDQQEYKNRMNRLGNRLEDNGFGGFLSLVSKQSNEAVQQTTSSQVFESVNQGVAIKSFLGHGGVTTTDFALDDVKLFDNSGYYPLIFSLGCKTGDMYDQQTSLSESFTLHPSLGGIGYIASAGFAYPSSLERLTQEFYTLLGDELYTAGVGDIMRQMRINQEVDRRNFAVYSLLEQMSYHGDPAIRLNVNKAPDYVIDNASVGITPNLMTAEQDSFSLNFDILNLGFNQPDTFSIQFRRTFPNGTTSVQKDTVSLGIGKNNFTFRFKLGEEQLEGEHRMEILIDADNEVAELPSGLAELNNELIDNSGRKGLSFFVQQNAILLIAPPPFGIVNEIQPQLVASANTLDPQERAFTFELDTTPDFNSSLKKTKQLKTRGGVISWQPDHNWVEGQVYHWRIKETSFGEERWSNRSFIYLPDSLDGWNQSQYYQVATDSLMNLVTVKDNRMINYDEGRISVEGYAMSHSEEFNNNATRFTYNRDRQYWGARWWQIADSHIFVSVFDPKTAAFWRNTGEGRFGSLGRDDHQGFVFPIENADNRNAICRLINDSVPEGHYVLVLTSQYYGSSLKVEEWAADSLLYGTNIFSTLEAEGALQVRALEDRGSLPYAFAFIKGEGPLGESLAFDINEEVVVNIEVPFLRDEGIITSPIIGPAKSWNKLSWQPVLIEGQSDEIELSLLKWNKERSTADTVVYKKSGYFDISEINANDYPYLQLKYRVRDPVDRSFAQLEFWRILYEGLPDLVLTTGEDFLFHADTLSQGEEFTLNASVMAFNAAVQDSIGLQFRLRSSGNQTTAITQQLGSMEAGASQPIELKLNTEALSGDQELVVEANPSRDIQEDQYANNLGVLPFFVQSDNENPILDVTFDGRHILNGELVSARPLINISLTDENEFLELKDTASFRIWLDFPEGSSREYFFDDPRIRFYAAEEGKKNRARVEFEPVLDLDGEYQLRIQASDATGNVAGASTYEVNFQVITESQLSNVLPYPNPFTTSCRFVYTLTGDREPVDFKIQIMTVSGRIVREITQFEFGQMKVGTHLSDFVWDGTDEFGDQLANGVYLYRVIAKDEEGENLKRFERTEVDGYFKKDFGKIVILR